MVWGVVVGHRGQCWGLVPNFEGHCRLHLFAWLTIIHHKNISLIYQNKSELYNKLIVFKFIVFIDFIERVFKLLKFFN